MTISRMTTVMESMADPVLLTDNQHRVIIQNRAAERFFRVPDLLAMAFTLAALGLVSTFLF